MRLIDQTSTLRHTALADAMQRLDILLFNLPDRHGCKVGTARGFGDRQRIVVIAFVATLERRSTESGQHRKWVSFFLVESYRGTITPQALAERIAARGFVYIVAEDPPSGICGVIGLRDARHVYHLFVREELHRQGLARELWQRVMSTSSSLYFTVNSSLFAVPVYTRLGFVRAGEQQSRNGVTVQPMVYSKVG